MEGSLTIFTEKGTVKIGGQCLNELEYQSVEGQTKDNLPEGNTANNYGKLWQLFLGCNNGKKLNQAIKIPSWAVLAIN